MTVESLLHFPWIETFKKVIKYKRGSRLLLWNQSQSYTWKSFSFSLNCYFQKRSLKETCDFCCETKPKMTAESPFHFYWIETFTKKWVKKTTDFSCEFKVQMACESHFHFDWIATLKKLHYSGQFDSFLETRAKWRSFHFDELNRRTEIYQILVVGLMSTQIVCYFSWESGRSFCFKT